MAAADCVGEGTGWGTIEGLRLRVLVLAAPKRAADGEAIARALAARHEAHLLAGRRLLASLEAARAAQAVKPQLLHAVGLDGRAKTARTLAAGSGTPLVVSLTAAEVEGATDRVLREVCALAAAVLVDESRAADALRARGMSRELYILAAPPGAAEEPLFLGAAEVIYGRVLGAHPEALEGAEEAPRDASGEPLVQLGRRGRP